MKKITSIMLTCILISLLAVPSFGVTLERDISNARIFRNINISKNALSADNIKEINVDINNKYFTNKKISLLGIINNEDSFNIQAKIDKNGIKDVKDEENNFDVLNIKLKNDTAFLILYKKDKHYMVYVTITDINNYYNEEIEYNRYWYGELLEPKISEKDITLLSPKSSGTKTKTKEKTYTYEYSIYGDKIYERLKMNFIYIYPKSKDGNEIDFNIKMKVKEKFTEIEYYDGRYSKEDGCSLFVPGGTLHLATDEGEMVVKTETIKNCTLKGKGLNFKYSWCYNIPKTIFNITSSYDEDKETNDDKYMYDGYGDKKATQVSVTLNPYKYHLEKDGHYFGVVAGVGSADGYSSTGNKKIKTKWDFYVQSISGSGANHSSHKKYSYSLYYDVKL
ncbi:hypothetical protein [Clostridiisalibacter paucivorans]|uniref:hypothetical protein n=1 Tax=Clostridiisalibacter paucivorans TaxID=408753 RepID=UPI00047DDA9D|nr:hypothetical protein [Clostridiisalibacter paucivorans]